jgi:flagellar hook-basal body complex protein FliE
VITPISGIGSLTEASGITELINPMPAPMAPMNPVPKIDGGAEAGAANTGGFGQLMTRAVTGLSDQLKSADRLQEAAATGALADPTEALVATQQADIALQTAIQVRNKLVEGWQELSRMSV